MGHYALEFEWRPWLEPRQNRREPFQTCTLAAHAGVNLQVKRQRAGPHSRGTRGNVQIVELRRLPYDGGQPMLYHCCTLAGNNAADYHDARGNVRTGAQRSRGYAFFHAGNGDPPGPRAQHRRSAQRQRVAVGISFEDGHELNIGSCQALEKSIVVFKEAGANLNPAGAHLHEDVLSSV